MEVRGATALSQSKRFQAHTRLKASPKGSAFGQLLITGMAVEKLHFRQNSEKLGDRKCLGKPRKSFVGLPKCKVFSAIFRRVSFSTAEGPAGGRGKAERNLSWPPYFCILRWSDRQSRFGSLIEENGLFQHPRLFSSVEPWLRQ